MKKIYKKIKTKTDIFRIVFLIIVTAGLSSCDRPSVKATDGSNQGQGGTPTTTNPPPVPTPAGPAVIGLCGVTNNACVAGASVDTEDSRTKHNWACNGISGGSNATCSAPRVVDTNCVQIFYDTTDDANFKFLGRTYGLMLSNLLGHFPEYQQILGPIDKYKKGDLDACRATFYIGSNFDKPLPADFISDYATTDKRVILIGYNFWQFGAEFEKAFGYSVANGDYQLTTLSTTDKSSDGKPGYFRDILYKGEVFEKFSAWKDTTQTTLLTSFEMSRLLKQTSPVATVLAQAKHSTSNEIIPWVYKAQGDKKFFVTEIPFSYIHEADRYFVFADLIFDFLGAPPKHNAKNAIIRIEDIHSQVELNFLEEAINILRRNSITPHVNIIPIYKDPNPEPDITVRMENEPAFAASIRAIKASGTVFIWHGVTHQYNDKINPFTGISGDDYEFWDFIRGTPIVEDSPQYVIDRLNDGFTSLKQFSIAPQLWVSPHYRSSAMDNIIFGDVFKWIVGRGVYNDFKATGIRNTSAAKPLYYDASNSMIYQNQKEHVSTLSVQDVPGFVPFGQLFSYELYGDIYRAKVIPENLGNVQPELNNQVVATRSVDRILADAKRNLVLRDVWASVFYHPFLLDPALNPENQGNPPQKDLERLVKGIQALGYTFVNGETYAIANSIEKRKPTIDLERQ